MNHILLAVALAFVVLAVWGFVNNRTALRNVVFALMGIGGVVTWLAIDTNNSGLLYALLSVVLLAVVMSIPVLVVFLLSNGLIMIRRESRTPGNLLSFVLGLITVGMLITFQQIFSATNVNMVLGWAWILAAFVLAYVALAFMVFLLAAWLYRAVPHTGKARYAIVLGARLIDGKAPPLLRARLDKAVELYHQHADNLVLIPSGGQGKDETMPEGVGMAEYLYNAGIPHNQVIIEDKAVNTQQNLELSRDLMDSPDAPTLVVTNNYHVFRAAMLARQIGLNAVFHGSSTKFYYLPSAILREYLAVMVQYKWLNLVVIAGIAAICGSGFWEAWSNR